MDRPPLGSFVATVPRGLADLTGQELRQLGAVAVRERTASVAFQGELAVGYRACLWSRTASRILLQVAEFEAPTADAFHAAVRAIDWREHIDPGGSIACEFTGQHPTITHSHFGALRLKDGICDQLREATGTRPDVSPECPQVRIHAHAVGVRISLLIDLAGEGLHRRGYRRQAGEAPLRENVAAGLLLRVGWPTMAAAGAEFLDPMCGSGTLVIEAAMLAADHAPGLLRDYWGFQGWRGHRADLWQELRAEAQTRARSEVLAPIRGTDSDDRVLRIADENARRAGVEALVQFAAMTVGAVRPLGHGPGLVAANPPYGERLGTEAGAHEAHRELGSVLREQFAGWEAAVLTAAPEGARALALRSYRTHELWNGALACRLLRFDLSSAGTREHTPGMLRSVDPALAAVPGAQMFANRLVKNLRLLGKQAKREQVSCYRLYDADMPEYAFAIDEYTAVDSSGRHLYVQEYAAPDSIEPAAVARRRAEAFAVLSQATGVPAESIHVRMRRRQSGSSQYTRLAERAQYTTVAEGGLKFLVNFSDYLDTGLFLDHRITRQRLRDAARDVRFLNLFCYTASATVYAAAGGAARSISVDLSNSYLDWAAENFRVNGLAEDRHELVRADCREWLIEAAQRGLAFELIFLDPPTFSNSKRMEGVLDTQRDHADLISACMRLLAPGGLLVFSTNAQRFRLDPAIEQSWAVTDVSAVTIPFDFKRNARIHRCYELRRPGG